MRRIGAWAQKNEVTFRRALRRRLESLTGLEINHRRPTPARVDRYGALLASKDERFRRDAIELEYGVFDADRKELYVTHDSGLYSCMTVTLWSLTDLMREGLFPLKINFSHTLQSYKDDPVADIYPDLFLTEFDVASIREIVRAHGAALRRFDHHGAYGCLSLEALKAVVDVYFRPGKLLAERIDAIRHRFIADDQRYLGVCFRGTDKGTEVIPTDSSIYLELSERLLAEGRADRVLIQTDQQQVSNLFRRTFGECCDVIEQLPRTSGTVAIHLNGSIEGSRLAFARDMMAAVHLLSKMEQVIVYTGNIGAWVALLRGSAEGLWQATPNGIMAQWDVAEPTASQTR